MNKNRKKSTFRSHQWSRMWF